MYTLLSVILKQFRYRVTMNLPNEHLVLGKPVSSSHHTINSSEYLSFQKGLHNLKKSKLKQCAIPAYVDLVCHGTNLLASHLYHQKEKLNEPTVAQGREQS